MTVAVEFKPENEADQATMTAEWASQSHPQASREVQLLEILNAGDMESWQLVVNVDLDNQERTFQIFFFDPRAVESDEKEDFLSGDISFKTGNSGLRDKINDYFEAAFGGTADTAVFSEITYYDALGNEVETVEGSNSNTRLEGDIVSATRTFTINLKTFIGQASFETAQIIYEDDQDAGKVTYTAPNASGPPLSKGGDDGGKFRIVCPDPADPDNVDKYAKTRPFKITEGHTNIQFYMDRDIPHLSFKHRIYAA